MSDSRARWGRADAETASEDRAARPPGDASTEPLPTAARASPARQPTRAPIVRRGGTPRPSSVVALGAPASGPVAVADPSPVSEPASEPVRPRATGPAVRRTAALVATGFGLVLLLFGVYLFGLSGLVHQRAQAGLLADLRTVIQVGPPVPEQVDGRLALPPPPERGSPVALLRIPSLGVSEIVVEGSRSADTTAGPGHVPASPLPGEPGTSVVVGHRTAYGGPFRRLDRLAPGDEVLATTAVGTFAYRVREVVVVEPGEPDRLAVAGSPGLTLTTSDPPGVASARLSVLAELDGEPLAPFRARARGLDAADLGLAGEAVALAPLLIWAQLLLVACICTARLYGRWSRRSTYLLTTPVLLVLLLLAFESLQRLLPATL